MFASTYENNELALLTRCILFHAAAAAAAHGAI